MAPRSLLYVSACAWLAACGFSAPDLDDDGDDGPSDGPTDDGDDTLPIDAARDSGEPACDPRDHDSDGRGDACDPCPHLADPDDDRDSDDDGIGDGCDPDPARPGDTRIAFYGFYADGGFGALSKVGNWFLSPDGWAELEPGSGGRYLSPQESFNVAYAQTRMQILTFDGERIGAGLSLGVVDEQREYSCGVARPDESEALALLYSAGSGGSERDQSELTEPVVGSAYAITMSIGPESARCDLSGVRPLAVDTGDFDGRVRLSTEGTLRARYDYLFVVRPGS